MQPSRWEWKGSQRRTAEPPPAAWCGVPCSSLAGAGRGVTSGNVEVSVVPDFGEGLENT